MTARTAAPGGLFLDVPRGRRAGLRVKAAGHGLFLLHQSSAGGDEVVLFGQLEEAWEGIDYLRTDRFRSPLPAIRTSAVTGPSAPPLKRPGRQAASRNSVSARASAA